MAIDQAYSDMQEQASRDISDNKVEDFVLNAVQQTLGRSGNLDRNIDLFAYGVDSIAAMRVRGHL
jgi:hypothetical protein